MMELKRKARERFAVDGPDVRPIKTLRDVLRLVGQVNTTDEMFIDRGAQLLETVRPKPLGRPKGSGVWTPQDFWMAREMGRKRLISEHIKEALKQNPDQNTDDIRRAMREPSESEIASIMGTWNSKNGRPNDTHWRLLRECRRLGFSTKQRS